MKASKTKRWIIFTIIFLIVISPMFTLFGTQHLRDKMLGQLTLKVMAERITEGEISDREKSLALFRYVHGHLYTPPNGKPAGDSILEVLVRNIAWCSRQSDILAMLARRVWVNGGYVSLFGYDDVSHHTVCALDLEDKLRMFDPFYGYIFWTEKGEIATLEQIRKQGNKLHSAQFSAVKRLQGMVADDYFRLFEPAHDWEIHIPSTPIWLKYMDYYYDALGDSFLRFYQHLYFLESKTDLFTRARLKQLTWQFESALKDFECIIESDNVIEPPVLRIDFNSVTKDLLNGEARFFRGQTYFDMKAYEACIRSFEEYLRLHPENRWKKLAYYYLGACNEALGDKEKAVEWYSMIEGEELPGTPAPERLMAILGRD